MDGWAIEASRILRAERVRAGLTYPMLRMRLEKIGVFETEFALRNKLSRGTFSFVFFLQCMHVMDRRTVDVSLEKAPHTAERKRRSGVGRSKAEKADERDRPASAETKEAGK